MSMCPSCARALRARPTITSRATPGWWREWVSLGRISLRRAVCSPHLVTDDVSNWDGSAAHGAPNHQSPEKERPTQSRYAEGRPRRHNHEEGEQGKQEGEVDEDQHVGGSPSNADQSRLA